MPLYLYLTKRNKNGVSILSVLRGGTCPATRIQDVTKLGLPTTLAAKLKNRIHEDRMEWEPWIESADSWSDLAKSLQKRGFSKLPLTGSPAHHVEMERLITSEEQREKIDVKTEKRPTMLRKRKR